MSRSDDNHLNGAPVKPKDGGASAVAGRRGNGTAGLAREFVHVGQLTRTWTFP